MKHGSDNYNSCTIAALSIQPLTNNFFSSEDQYACQPRNPKRVKNTKKLRWMKPNLDYNSVRPIWMQKKEKKNTSLPTISSNDEMMMTQKSEKDKSTDGGVSVQD